MNIYKLHWNEFESDDNGSDLQHGTIDLDLQLGGGWTGRKLTEADLNQIYGTNVSNNVNEGAIDDREKEMVRSTYGEMLFDSVEKLINELQIGRNDVFYDLGSGNGRVVMQIFANAGVKKAIGIEFYPERWLNAEYALMKFHKLFPQMFDDDRVISYHPQNIKDVYTLGDATYIYMCSTCYPPELLDVVYEKIKKSTYIKCVITHKEHPKFLEILPNQKTISLPCTWSNNLTWYIYCKK